ncbi:MAG TPA: hypothetical protein VM056_04325, partial [Terriglobales bacterium]|nr:hypothetical protein [Terriglobales bacterium]
PGIDLGDLKMKRYLVCLFSILILTSAAVAQGQPAAQHASSASNWNIVFNENKWVHLNKAVVKMPEQKDLFIHVTFECGLLEGGSETAFTDAVVRLIVTVDGKDAGPGRFESCGKTNELVPKFSNLIGCTDARGGLTRWSNCSVSAAQDEQIKRSLRSHTTNFVMKDVGVGVHEVVVKAYLWNGEPGKVVRALVGDVSLEAEIVRLVRDGK